MTVHPVANLRRRAWPLRFDRWRWACLAAGSIWLIMNASAAAFEVSHDLSVTLVPEAAGLSGTDRMLLKGGPPDRLAIGLHPRIRIQSLMVNGRLRSPDLTPNGPMLALTKAECEAPIELTIQYAGQFQDQAPTLPVNTDNPGYGVSGTISPRGTLLLGGAGWYPAISGAVETVHLRVEAPEGITAVTAGRATGIDTMSGKTISTWQIDPPAGRLALSAGPYVITSSKAGNIPVATYFLSDDQDLADTYLKATVDYLALYEDQFGPYPFPKFAIVENFFPTGYGFPSYTLIGGRVLRLPFIVQTSLGHEIAHCWWGNGVQVDPSDGNWSEGLTSYVAEHFYQERISAEAARQHRRQLLRNYATLVAPGEDFPLRRFTHRDSPPTQAIGYDKSAMIFHMLRQIIGERAFWEGLRHLFATRCHQTATWSDLQSAFEYTWGHDLKWFFHQWLDRPGAPSLWLEDIQTGTVSANTYRVQGVLRQKAPFYRLEVPLTLSGRTSETAVRIAIDGRAAPFQITVRGEPIRLEADPRTDVFRRLGPEEIPASINALKRQAPLIVIVPSEPISAVQRQTAETLAGALGRSNIVFRTEKDFDSEAAVTEDLVFLGIPAHSSLRPPLQDAIAFRPEGFEIDGQVFDSRKACFFGVWRHPRSDARVMAVLTEGSEDFQTTIARKIPHYGRYSYLVFEEATNRVKGTWPPASSPLVYTWPGTKNRP